MSESTSSTSFTLSFGGIEFCLEPNIIKINGDNKINDNDNSIMNMNVTKIDNGEVLINLNNYCGTLRIMNNALSTGLKANDDINDDENMSIDNNNLGLGAPKVEEEPSPPVKSSEGNEEDLVADEETKDQKGQQKLNFFGKSGKKANSKKSETHKSSVAASSSKRNEGTLESANRKKPRKSEAESPPLEICGIDEAIRPAIQSLGQTMPSQEDSRDSYDMSPLKPMEETSIVTNKKLLGGPCSRWGQSMTMIDNTRFIVYGGQAIENDGEAKPLEDLFVYNLEDGSWTRPMNCDGVARTWHTANFLPERQLLLCFGGEKLNDTGKLVTTEEVMVLDTEIMLWYPPQVSGQKPSGRGGHASCVLPNSNELVVFGGVKNGKWLNSVSTLDTNRWRWTTVKAVGDAPPPRSYHTSTAIGSDDSYDVDRVVIFGGNDGDKCFDGVHVLETGRDGKKWVWSHPKCKGDGPSPRTGHTATLLNDGSTILVYGGWDPNTEDEKGDDLIFDDSFLLDTKSWTWSKGPKPKYQKSKNNASNGGANRVGHSSVLAPHEKNGVQVLSFGGRLPENKFAGDFQSLIVPL